MRKCRHALRGHYRLEVLYLQSFFLSHTFIFMRIAEEYILRRTHLAYTLFRTPFRQCTSEDVPPNEKLKWDRSRKRERLVDELRKLIAFP